MRNQTLDIRDGFIPYKAYFGVKDTKKEGKHGVVSWSSSCYQEQSVSAAARSSRIKHAHE